MARFSRARRAIPMPRPSPHEAKSRYFNGLLGDGQGVVAGSAPQRGRRENAEKPSNA
jgi:hypothetical protein